MNTELNLFAKIKDGKLEISYKDSYNNWLRTCKEGDDIIIKFRNQKNYYSNRQLRLIYHQFRELSIHLGYSVEDIKTMLKIKFGYCYTATVEGQEITNCKSISDFDRKELSEFIVAIHEWAQRTLDFPLLKYEDLKFLKNV